VDALVTCSPACPPIHAQIIDGSTQLLKACPQGLWISRLATSSLAVTIAPDGRRGRKKAAPAGTGAALT
jgi:hypothetical protein